MKHTEDFHNQLRATARLLAPIAPRLAELPKAQIEEIILWLKDHHNPPDEDESGWDTRKQFDDQLESLRNSEEQRHLQTQAVRYIAWAITCGVGIGIILCGGLITALATDYYWTTAFVVCGIVYYLPRKGLRLGIQALLLSKKQEHHHHLQSYGAARCVTDLDHAGLLYLVPPPNQRLTEEQRNDAFEANLAHLRDAIYRHACEGALKEFIGDA
jgi:hypothetical protein